MDDMHSQLPNGELYAVVADRVGFRKESFRCMKIIALYRSVE